MIILNQQPAPVEPGATTSSPCLLCPHRREDRVSRGRCACSGKSALRRAAARERRVRRNAAARVARPVGRAALPSGSRAVALCSDAAGAHDLLAAVLAWPRGRFSLEYARCSNQRKEKA